MANILELFFLNCIFEYAFLKNLQIENNILQHSITNDNINKAPTKKPYFSLKVVIYKLLISELGENKIKPLAKSRGKVDLIGFWKMNLKKSMILKVIKSPPKKNV